jgi:hypothetical protein
VMRVQVRAGRRLGADLSVAGAERTSTHGLGWLDAGGGRVGALHQATAQGPVGAVGGGIGVGRGCNGSGAGRWLAGEQEAVLGGSIGRSGAQTTAVWRGGGAAVRMAGAARVPELHFFPNVSSVPIADEGPRATIKTRSGCFLQSLDSYKQCSSRTCV